MNTYKVVIRDPVTHRCLQIHETHSMNESEALESARNRYPQYEKNPMKVTQTRREK